MILTHILKNECPRCHHGKVFPTSLLGYKINNMHKECPECHLDFTKEPGFYWGAMYVSYGLGLAEVVLAYIICRMLGTATFDMINLWAGVVAVIILSAFNFKVSRMVWLYLFPGK